MEGEPMEPRRLEFTDFSQAFADIDRLHREGYTQLGQWDLAQACDHLGYFVEGSLDGPNYKVPWLFKVLFGRLVIRRILKQRSMKAGIPTPQKPSPEPGGDETAAIGRYKELIRRLQSHEGELHASPFFGYLSPQEWHDLHLIHCAHHLGFLIPKTTTV
jgi:hypothetical protein